MIHPCKDCKQETRRDHYMVWPEVWCEAGMLLGYHDPGLFLCIACLERRLGRELRPWDFTDAPINNPRVSNDVRAELLLSRLDGHAVNQIKIGPSVVASSD